jgi:periplasmic divalent cation tolerance protein
MPGTPGELTGCCQVTIALPDRALADHLAARLVEERLAACAQVLGPVSSIYRWKGTIEGAEEWHCYLKTTLARVPALRTRVLALHPYEVPEIIVLPIVGGEPAYLRWVQESVQM